MPTTLESYAADVLQPHQMPDRARTVAGRFAPNLVIAKGTVLAVKASDGLLYAYVNGITGVSAAAGIAAWSIRTNATSQVFIGPDTTASAMNPAQETAPVFICGTFFPSDLTGYDLAALADFKGRILPDGDIYIP